MSIYPFFGSQIVGNLFMDIEFKKFKVTTPLGDEEYSIMRSGSTLLISSDKGSSDFVISSETESSIMALGSLTFPFDCSAKVHFGKQSYISLIDPTLNEEFLTCSIEVL